MGNWLVWTLGGFLKAKERLISNYTPPPTFMRISFTRHCSCGHIWSNSESFSWHTAEDQPGKAEVEAVERLKAICPKCEGPFPPEKCADCGAAVRIVEIDRGKSCLEDYEYDSADLTTLCPNRHSIDIGSKLKALRL
jgi:hypothetical protein